MLRCEPFTFIARGSLLPGSIRVWRGSCEIVSKISDEHLKLLSILHSGIIASYLHIILVDKMWEAFFWDTTSNNLSLTNAHYTTDIFPDPFLSLAYLSKLKFSYLNNSFVNPRCNYFYFILFCFIYLGYIHKIKQGFQCYLLAVGCNLLYLALKLLYTIWRELKHVTFLCTKRSNWAD